MGSVFDVIMKTSGRAITPEGYTSREIVCKALNFEQPPRIPFSFNTHNSDIMFTINFEGAHREPIDEKTYKDQWGVIWEKTGKDWDHAIGHPIKDLEQLDQFVFPEINYSVVNPFTKNLIDMGKASDKYILGVNFFNMFELLRSLLGFEGLMMAAYLQPEKLRELLDKLADFTCKLIDNYTLSGGIDGFITYEDWGLQKGLQMSLEQFREFYKPVYQRIIDHCHKNNIQFFWHCCGDILKLIPEMVEMQVDAVQLDQPLLMGYENLIDVSQGKLCFFNSIDIQWTALPEVSIDEIKQETKRMIQVYQQRMPNGGLIIKHYNQPWDIDLTESKELAIVDAFIEIAHVEI